MILLGDQDARDHTFVSSALVAPFPSTSADFFNVIRRLRTPFKQIRIGEGLEYTALWNSVQLQTADLSDSVKAFASKVGGRPSFRPLKARL